MTGVLTADEVAALRAWVLVLQRACTDSDRRTIAIAALADLGAGPWVLCQTCDSRPMQFHAAYRHLADLGAGHRLVVNGAAVAVPS